MTKLIDYKSRNSTAFRLRQKRGRRIVALIEMVHERKGQVEIVDIGGTQDYWDIIPADFLRRKNVHITLLNVLAPPEFNEGSSEGSGKGLFSNIQGDGCNLNDIENNRFDIAHSNSVIEHVGDWNKKTAFAEELRRIAGSYYLQTPNHHFPIEPHFLFPFYHWLPVPVRIMLAMKFSLGCFPKAASVGEAIQSIELCRLLTKKMLRELFPDATLYEERYFLLAKSFVVIGTKP
jgi:hypothetical protein